jgi:hypothetical protein
LSAVLRQGRAGDRRAGGGVPKRAGRCGPMRCRCVQVTCLSANLRVVDCCFAAARGCMQAIIRASEPGLAGQDMVCLTYERDCSSTHFRLMRRFWASTPRTRLICSRSPSTTCRHPQWRWRLDSSVCGLRAAAVVALASSVASCISSSPIFAPDTSPPFSRIHVLLDQASCTWHAICSPQIPNNRNTVMYL